MSNKSEKDFLVYEGNKIPRVIRLVWFLLGVFALFYLITYMWPDLVRWL